MKIYNKITFEWKDGEYVKTAEESYEYDGPVAECKGGGSSQQNYQNLERLYGVQADQAELLGGYAKDTVLPAYKGFLQEARGYGSQANQQAAAAQAGSYADAATSSARANQEAQMASFGINPGSGDWWKNERANEISGAASKAAGMSAAAEGVRDKGFARTQDAVSLGMGTPTQASAAANSATNTAQVAMSGRQADDAARMNGIGSAVRGGFNLYNAWNQAADGGQILHLNGGGYVQHLAGGGVLGANRGIVMPPPRPPQPLTSPVQEAVNGAVGMASSAGGGSLAHGLGKGVSAMGDMTGSTGMQAFGNGMEQAPGIKDMATSLVDKALGNTAAPQAMGADFNAMASTLAEESASHAAEGVAADAAGTAAADTATTVAADAATDAALTTAGSTLGAAIPVIGAGLAAYSIGNAAGWWADGGDVTPGSQGQTGDVSGPGGPKDDLIPAMLSNGEFVMPVGAVKKFGLDKLEKMRQAGLEFEHQLGIQNGQSRTGGAPQRGVGRGQNQRSAGR